MSQAVAWFVILSSHFHASTVLPSNSLPMKFSDVLEMIDTMRVALMIGLPAVLRAIFATPSLVFNPAALSRISMANIWIQFGNGSDQFGRADKKLLITPHARGVVLDLGAGALLYVIHRRYNS